MRRLKHFLVVVGIIVGSLTVFVVVILIAYPADKASTDETTVIQTSTVTPPTAVPTISPETRLRQIVEDKLGKRSSRRGRLVNSVERKVDSDGEIILVIDWALGDYLFGGLNKFGAKSDVKDTLEALTKSGMQFDWIFMRGNFPLVDLYGNVSEVRVVDVSYTRSTLNLINWDNFLVNNVYRIAETMNIHPTFRD